MSSSLRFIRFWVVSQMLMYPLGKLTYCYGKSPFLMGKSTINGPFSTAMLVCQRVYITYIYIYTRYIYTIYVPTLEPFSRANVGKQPWAVNVWVLYTYIYIYMFSRIRTLGSLSQISQMNKPWNPGRCIRDVPPQSDFI